MATWLRCYGIVPSFNDSWLLCRLPAGHSGSHTVQVEHRKHSHNGLWCLDNWGDCPGGCINHLQDERCTSLCIKEEGVFEFVPQIPATEEPFDARTQDPPAGTIFKLLRRHDESGVSGTGVVLEGVIFKDGTVSVRWCTENAPTSTTTYGIENGVSGWRRFMDIHIQSHHNDVQIEFTNGHQTWTWEQNVPVEEEQQRYIDRLYSDIGRWTKLFGEMPSTVLNFHIWLFRRTTEFQDEMNNIVGKQLQDAYLQAILKAIGGDDAAIEEAREISKELKLRRMNNQNG